MRKGKARRKFPVGSLIKIRKPYTINQSKPQISIGLVLDYIEDRDHKIVVILSDKKVFRLDQKFLFFHGKTVQRPYGKR